jgi:uncharacterized membrane protein
MDSESLSQSPNVRRIIFIILPLMYLAGLIGLNVPLLEPYFRLLTPFNLIASLALLLLFHTDWRPSFLLYCVLAFSVGFLVEVAGVHTGLIFGEYAYGAALGFKLAEVPLVIGTNWLMLTYLCGSVSDRLPYGRGAKIAAAAALMTLLDVLIEPVAIRLDFWSWNADQIPVQNYIAWYAISALLFFAFFFFPFKKNNILAPLLLVLQFLFFGFNSLLHLID